METMLLSISMVLYEPIIQDDEGPLAIFTILQDYKKKTVPDSPKSRIVLQRNLLETRVNPYIILFERVKNKEKKECFK